MGVAPLVINEGGAEMMVFGWMVLSRFCLEVVLIG